MICSFSGDLRKKNKIFKKLFFLFSQYCFVIFNHEVTHDCATNLDSKEFLKVILFKINGIIPGLVIRTVDWIPRVQLHGVNDVIVY